MGRWGQENKMMMIHHGLQSLTITYVVIILRKYFMEQRLRQEPTPINVVDSPRIRMTFEKPIHVDDERRFAYKLRNLFGTGFKITLPNNYPILPSEHSQPHNLISDPRLIIRSFLNSFILVTSVFYYYRLYRSCCFEKIDRDTIIVQIPALADHCNSPTRIKEDTPMSHVMLSAETLPCLQISSRHLYTVATKISKQMFHNLRPGYKPPNRKQLAESFLDTIAEED
ncbi:hypothetical protein G5I_03713 [Acromyrmex echinatior]|uniref:Uncharacterized protein n=1 Tax=Acromyrmex echinatior TaxID=103372 RepID=F4WDQ5_ACREC|nr:hypothetical protein G5I_03713 [Acromyrmex echinatior]